MAQNTKYIIKALFKNKFALVSIIFICFCICLSIFAFVIIPDRTIDANEQSPQLSLKSPGFSCQMLNLPRNLNRQKKSWPSRLMFGQYSDTEYIPIKDWRVEDGSVLLSQYNGILKTIPLEKLDHKKSIASHISTKHFYLGTDRYGRDILSRIVLGLRISLLVGFLAVIISLTIGVLIGLSSAFFGGWVDGFFMWLINTVWSIPTILLVFAIVLALGKSIYIIFLAVGLTLWVDVARLIRGQVKDILDRDFLKAAKTLAYSDWRIMFVHILPNLTGPLMVIAASNFAIAILIESGLSYLGFGVQPPTPSLGNMLYENYGFAISGKVFAAIIPAIVIMLLVLSFNLIGDSLRDIFDVKQKHE